MKNLPKRTKIVLAIVGIVFVSAVVGLVITQTPAGELLGTTALVITPSNPTITEGSTLTLKVNSILCGWKSSDPSAVSIVFATQSSVTVKGLKSGTSSTITVVCFTGVRASTTVTVGPPPTPPVITIGPDTGKSSPYIGVNERLTLCANDPSVQWDIRTNKDASLVASLYAPGCIAVVGDANGSAYVDATTSAGGVATVEIYVVTGLTMSPAYPTISVGQSITMSAALADSTSPWSIFKGCENPAATCPVRLSSTKGHSVTITGQAKGAVVIINDYLGNGQQADWALTVVKVQ